MKNSGQHTLMDEGVDKHNVQKHPHPLTPPEDKEYGFKYKTKVRETGRCRGRRRLDNLERVVRWWGGGNKEMEIRIEVRKSWSFSMVTSDVGSANM